MSLRTVFALAALFFALLALAVNVSRASDAFEDPATVVHAEASDEHSDATPSLAPVTRGRALQHDASEGKAFCASGQSCGANGQRFAGRPAVRAVSAPFRYVKNHHPVRKALGFVFCRHCR